jgi:gamma-glutamylcyclotransferase (GGCT)/AIG2-like uncharacterized protein YtfP
MDLFTYGTLMDPEVWQRAAGRRFPCERATLEDYSARRLRGVHFPGLIEAAGAVTPGLLYRGVDAPAMQRLDEYEDDFYQRIAVKVITENGEMVTAQVYLVAPDQRHHVMDERWLPPFPVEPWGEEARA